MTEICDPTWPNPTQSMDGPDPRPSLQPGHKPPTLYLYLKCIGRWKFNFKNPRWRTAYTIARYMLSLCVRLSVGPSVCHKPVLYRNESTWFLAKRLLSTYPILCYKEIRVYQNLRYFPLGLFIPNSGLWKFRHGKSIAFLTTLVVVVVDGRACWRHLYDDRRVVMFTTSRRTVTPVTPSLRFVADLMYNLLLQLTRFLLTARRPVRLR